MHSKPAAAPAPLEAGGAERQSYLYNSGCFALTCWLLHTLVLHPFQTCSCPSPAEKLAVLKEMIFPNCEKLGQTMIFVRTKETSRALHGQMQNWGYKITSIQVG
jgi:hypothetical protein